MKRIVVFFVLSLLTVGAFAQKQVDFENEPSFWDRVYFGGGLGFFSDNNQTNLSVSPVVGYMITTNLSAGLGLTYQYIKWKNLDKNTNLYGGNTFVRYNIKQFFLQGEYNLINYPVYDSDFQDRENMSRVLLGGGISQPIGERAAINFMALYDVAYDVNGIYSSPWEFRVFVSL
ncbi:hypothetical protein [Fulvivirga sediminis]|uniref:Outer membrane protein beta-barrel domain-containing protein n=1 Tax=Fulvivirga sediminis TaxID=2803949 RepID=A0A937F5H3_9BACT|nr:hypothetical protein [Fulvivirga sediminis]MBL3656792.1 hypothetical protein [Fulvivirga sediminis]